MNILAGKQVGPIYYMVKDVEILKVIVSQGVIRTSILFTTQNSFSKDRL